jgi:N-acetylglucosamine-6-phosphate deacetylase
LYITPGLIDIHFHGGCGCNFLDPDLNEIEILKQDLIKHGITAALPTIMTGPQEEMIKAIQFFNDYIDKQDDYSPQFIGINVEGPFLSPEKKGIQPEKYIQKLNSLTLEKFLYNKVRIITLDPDQDQEGFVIPYLTRRGIIVSLGHSLATYDSVCNAILNGASLITHLYNAMERFHHRQLGIISAALVEDSVYVELIADGVHVHPGAIKLAVKAKPSDKVILVSDAIALRGQPAKKYFVDGEEISIKENTAYNKEGVISGSIITIDECIRNIVKWGITDFATAVGYATFNPSRLLGFYNKEYGCIYQDCLADLVLWDKETLEIKATMIKGKLHWL